MALHQSSLPTRDEPERGVGFQLKMSLKAGREVLREPCEVTPFPWTLHLALRRLDKGLTIA